MAFKSGFVAVIGRPNAGKSTFINCMVGEKIAITSPKPQTTRNRITAILTREDCQIVFLDTPGIHRPKNRLGEYMVKTAADTMPGADVILVLHDCTHKTLTEADTELFQQAARVPDARKMLLLTKIDLVKKEEMLSVIAAVSEIAQFDEIIPVSALKHDGIDIVTEAIVKALPEGPLYFPEDQATESSLRDMTAEIIREKILYFTDNEVPHGTSVEIVSFKEPKRRGGVCEIEANIYCEKASHKGILIGKDGAMLKRIGTAARQDIEKLSGWRTVLRLWVKVREDWRNNPGMLREFGYKEEK